MSREQFLARVREAATAGRQYRVHTRPFPADAGYLGAGDDPVARFAAEVTAVGGQAQIVQGDEAARQKLREILQQVPRGGEPARNALTWEHPLLERLQLTELLAEEGFQRMSHASLKDLSPEDGRRKMLGAEVGITSVAWAVAETGSAAVASGPGTERLASLLPPFYVTVVEQAQLLPDLFDVFARLDPSTGFKLPSNLAFITGPSKTGDIELRLTTGVHGPGIWHVVVIRS